MRPDLWVGTCSGPFIHSHHPLQAEGNRVETKFYNRFHPRPSPGSQGGLHSQQPSVLLHEPPPASLAWPSISVTPGEQSPMLLDTRCRPWCSGLSLVVTFDPQVPLLAGGDGLLLQGGELGCTETRQLAPGPAAGTPSVWLLASSVMLCCELQVTDSSPSAWLQNHGN